MSRWKIHDVEYLSDKINPNLAVSPWSGHRQFAYDMIEYLKPERVVELGTHYGCSFFAFLQACKDFNLDTQVIAIDCWEGDEQAGFYGDDVYNTVEKTVKEYFPQQNSKMIRKYFKDALGDVEDESVDVLHIDGLHTYEAVTEDFNTWLCKLKPDGVVLFHDVASILNYGTNDFWREICEKYKETFHFEHSWGLGILFPKGDRLYREFVAENMEDKIPLYTYKAEYELCRRQLEDHVKMVQDRDAAIKSNEAMINERDEAIKKCEAMIDDRDKTIKSCEAMIQDRDAAIKSNEAMINERDELIRKYEEIINEYRKN